MRIAFETGAMSWGFGRGRGYSLCIFMGHDCLNFKTHKSNLKMQSVYNRAMFKTVPGTVLCIIICAGAIREMILSIMLSMY